MKLSFLKHVFFAALIPLCWNVRAQDPFHIIHSIAEGFPSQTVYSVNQDTDGILWFTTDSGIVKYDSHHYTSYTTNEGLADNEVFQMLTDSRGRTWFLTLNGKLSYRYKDKFYNESNTPFLKKISGDGIVMDLYEEADHTLGFVYKNGELIVLKPDGGITRKKITQQSFAGYWNISGTGYILTNYGVYNMDTRDPLLALEKQVSYYRAYHSIRKRRFSARNCYYEIESDGTVKTLLEVPKLTDILHVFEEDNTTTWVCTRNGLYQYENNVFKRKYFTNHAITGMLKDFEGGYWLSTLKDGVLYIPSFFLFMDKGELKINCVSANANNEIWFGSENNDYYIKKEGYISRKNIFRGQLSDNILKIKFFKDNTYVVGKSGVLQINRQGEQFMITANANDLHETNTRIYLASSIAMLFTTKGFNASTTVFGNTLLRESTNVITGGSDEEIWFGTNNALYHYSPNEKHGLRLLSSKDSRLQTSFKDLLYDSNNGLLFAATNSNGLLVLKDNRVIAQALSTNGLNSNSCTSIKKIGNGTYLVGNYGGLNEVRVVRDKITVRSLNAILGIKSKKVNDIAWLDNVAYVATNKGLISFKLHEIDMVKNHPKCIIEYLKNNNKPFDIPIPEFDYTHNDISIKYNGISYKNPDNISYHYKLNTQEGWTISKETQINFQSLPAGDYCFSVYCTDTSGNASSLQQISFKILAPFWQKAWFLALSLLLLGFVIYQVVRDWTRRQRLRFEAENNRIRLERNKAHLEKHMVELEQKALRLQMNPHFIFNALNTIKGYYAEGDPLNASSYISKFSKLLRMLLENTEQTVTLAKEIEMLDLYIHLNKIRYKDKFDYKLVVDKELEPEEILIPTLLIQPMVENAIIHGLSPKANKGTLTISFIKEGILLHCIVEDNGVGRMVAKMRDDIGKAHESKALKITTERLHLFSNNSSTAGIKIDDLYLGNQAAGTRITITIPLINLWD